MNKYIQRSIEKEITKAAKQFPVIAVTGPRQSGKSTMLTHLFPNYDYVTFDDLDIRTRAETDPALFVDSFTNPVIIDEIQYVPKVLSYIKINVDKYTTKLKNAKVAGKFIVTGSQMFTLMAGLTESLAGRVMLFELLPFSFEEIGKKPHSPVSCYEQILKGFYPKVNTERLDIRSFYGSYLATYIERDVRQIQNIKDIRVFQDFIKLLAARAGGLLNLQEISKELGTAQSTVKSWLGILEVSRLVYILPPYYTNITKRVVKTPKLYFVDTGLLAYLLGYQTAQTLMAGPAAGMVFENMIIMESLKYKINNQTQDDLYFYRDSNGVEADLILNDGKEFNVIEIKAGKKLHTESVKSLEKIPLKPAKKMVVSLRDNSMPLTKDIQEIPWWECEKY